MKKTLEQLFDEFLREIRFSAKLSDTTLKGYKDSFSLLMKIFPNLSPDMLTSNLMLDFFEKLDKRDRVMPNGNKKKGVKRSTVATYRSKLNGFFKWLIKNKYLKENPFDAMDYPKVYYENKKFLKREEIEKIFTAVGFNINWENNFIRKRNIAIIYILLFCGLRRGELLGLKIFLFPFIKIIC